MKIALENMPPVLQEAHSKVVKLEIEKEALKKETDQKSKNRVKEIEKEIADFKEKTSELEMKWNNEKETVSDIKNLKKQLEEARREADNAEAEWIWPRRPRSAMARLPMLEKDLDSKTKRLKKLQSSRRILKEEITENDIATIVSKWTGVPVSRMLEEEAEKLNRAWKMF